MNKLKLISILFVLLSSISISLSSQNTDRFYYLYPGWTITHVHETLDRLFTFGHTTNSESFEIPPIMNEINLLGDLMSTQVYEGSDTIAGMCTYEKKGYFVGEDYILASGCFKEYLNEEDFLLSPALFYFNKDTYHIDSTINLKPYFYGESIIVQFFYKYENILHLFATINTSTETTVRQKSMFCIYNLQTKELNCREYFGSGNTKVKPIDAFKLEDNGYLVTTTKHVYTYDDNYITYIDKIDENGLFKWRIQLPTNEVVVYYNNVPWTLDTHTFAAYIFDAPNERFYVVWSDPTIREAYPTPNPEGTIYIAKLKDEDTDGILYHTTDLQIYLGELDEKSWFIADGYQDADGSMYLLMVSYDGDKSSLLKINYDGEAVWLRTYMCFPGDSDESKTILKNLTPAADGGFFLGGEFRSEASELFPTFIQSAVLIKVDENGCLYDENCGESQSDIYIYNTEPCIYPNPASSILNIEFENIKNGSEIQYQIYSINGQVQISQQETYINPLQIDISDLSQGEYTIIIYGNGKIFSGKFHKI